MSPAVQTGGDGKLLKKPNDKAMSSTRKENDTPGGNLATVPVNPHFAEDGFKGYGRSRTLLHTP